MVMQKGVSAIEHFPQTQCSHVRKIRTKATNCNKARKPFRFYFKLVDKSSTSGYMFESYEIGPINLFLTLNHISSLIGKDSISLTSKVTPE